jgi:hypothetical protein
MSIQRTNSALRFPQWMQSHRNSLSRACLGLIVGSAGWTAGSVAAHAQQANPTPASAPVAYSSVSELNSLVGQLQQTSTAMQADLEKMRIEKWKTDASTKRQTQANVDSIRRNLQSALPEITAQLNASPEDMAASFKLYRNLDALYDVFGSVVESAGAFGTKDDFQSLSNDMNGLESVRHAFAERMQKLASTKEDELSRLRAQVKTLTAAPPPPPKKIVVDDTEPPKKPAPKKKTAKPGTPAKPANPADNNATAPPK